MPFQLEPEFAEKAGPVLQLLGSVPKPGLHDIETRRTNIAGMSALFEAMPKHPDLLDAEYFTEREGRKIILRWFHTEATKKASTPGPAILHIHGGGMIAGDVSLFARPHGNFAATTGVPMLSVDYQLAPESTGTGLVEDCYAGLIWLRDHAKELNIDPARIGVIGESAGGGLAAGLALYARDQKFSPPLKKQILIYPMLDDRNTVADEEVEPFAIWKAVDNITGWTALLGKDVIGTDKVSIYAAPARATDLTGLPPAYIDVGELDIFRDENLEYAKRLGAARVGIELHLHPGVPHAYEWLGPAADVSKRALADRARAAKSF